MRMRNWLAGAVLAGVCAGVQAAPAVDPVVTLDIEQHASVPGGVVPNPASGNANSLFYAFETPAGTGIEDTLPIELCSTGRPGADRDGNPTSGYPQTLHFSGANGNLPGVTVPADVTFTADGCVTVHVYVSTGALDEGSYMGNINIGLVNAQNDPAVQSPVKTSVYVDKTNEIHIHAKATAAAAISCFTTDSGFNFLLDCAGGLVTQGSAGTFAIVTNKKNVQVATNPGQFYYNLLYTNTSGADQVVSVDFFRGGVKPHGAQAIHAMVFPSYPMFSFANFDAVNSAIPGGADDRIENVTVPAGWTVWVDYHLEWAATGTVAPANIGKSCGAANQAFSVTGWVSVDGQPVGDCGAGGIGYRK